MNRKNYIVPVLIMVTLLSACPAQTTPTSNSSVDVSVVSMTATPLIEPTIQSSATSQVGCILPATKISDQNIRYFYWSDNSELIFYKEKDGQIWYSYNTVSGQTNPVTIEATDTPLVDYSVFGISNYEEVFVSPEQEIIVITRGTPESYDVYYKHINEQQEHYLGVVQGLIKEVNWLNNENNAVIAMEWNSPIGIPEAHLYMINFPENELVIEIPQMKDYQNLEYLGLTPDKTRLLFVSYGGKQNDVTVKLWNISTNEITSTTLFNPLDLHWVSESQLLSISQNPDLFSVVSVELFDVSDSRLTNLGDVSIDPFIFGAIQISPDGSSIAYIENETNNLYWTVCRY